MFWYYQDGLTGTGAGATRAGMATPTLSALTALLDRQRQALARLQEDIAAIERTIAVLKGRPAAPPPRAPP